MRSSRPSSTSTLWTTTSSTPSDAAGAARTAAETMVLTALEATRKAGLKADQVDLTRSGARSAGLSGDSVSVLPSHGDAEALVESAAASPTSWSNQNGVPRFVRVC